MRFYHSDVQKIYFLFSYVHLSMYKMVSSGMPASVALEVTSWAKERDGPRNGSEFLGVRLTVSRERTAGATHSVAAWPRRGADVSCGAPTRGGQYHGQDVLMIKTCFYTINYVLCKQRVAEY